MAISETTKVEIARVKGSLHGRVNKNAADIITHQNAIDKLTAENEAIQIRMNALTADIPKPTVIAMEK